MLQMNKTDLFLFHVLRKQIDISVPMDKGISKYVRIVYVQEYANWNLPEDQGRFKESIYDTRPCTAEDFPNNDYA